MERDRKGKRHVEPMTVRLTVEDDEEWKRIAEDEGVPPSILARMVIKQEIQRRKQQREGKSTDER